jgi:hypothetical protein
VFDYPGEVLIDEMDLVIDESCDESNSNESEKFFSKDQYKKLFAAAYENDVLMLFYLKIWFNSNFHSHMAKKYLKLNLYVQTVLTFFIYS